MREGGLPEQKVHNFLVAVDLAECHCTSAVVTRLLHAANGGCRLLSDLGGKLLVWGFVSGALAGSLLGVGHVGVDVGQWLFMM